MFGVHRGFAAHADARPWLEDRLNGPERVGLPWASLLAFVRLSAIPAVVTPPIPFDATLATVSDWLALPSTWIPHPTERHGATLAGLLDGETKADLVPDAHLAALAIEHGLTLCSTDRDFARFEGLRWTDPLRA